MQKVTANMTDEQKKQFTADFMTLTMPSMMKTAFQSAFSKEGPRVPDETTMLKPLHGLTADEIHAKAEEMRRNMATAEAKEKVKAEVLKKDRNAILRKAVEAMRKAAAENFGTAESQEAQITADQSGIKNYGEEKWEVTGQYVGSDKEGKKFRASWTATISVMFGTLQCEQLKLGDRQYQAEPAVVPPPAPEKKETEWVVAPTPARLGDVEVKVVSAKVAPVALRGPTGEGQSKEPQLILTIEVSNTNQNRKIDYRTWAGADLSFERDSATLKDNFENTYKRITFGIFDRPIGRVVSDSVYPSKSLTDVLVFEAPLEKIQHLDLDLPGKNIGEKGLFKIRIPSTMIQKSEKSFEEYNSTKQDDLAPATEKGLAVPKAKAGFPSIAGVWQEGPEENRIRVTVTQNAEKFIATCTYQDKKHGKISWRMTGTISKEGEIKGSLVHTKAPRGWLNQTRTGKFSATDGTITGHATFPGGEHAFEWKLLDN